MSMSALKESLDFVEKVPPSVYQYLEQVWFRDVITMDAYLLWEEKGAVENWPSESRKGDYLEACERYRKLLADQTIKRGPEKFVSVRDYLAEKYLDGEGERLDSEKRLILVTRKSRQIHKFTNKPANDDANWCQAADYVDGFYNNIISAVINADGVN
jgi:hypothetical protein